MYTKHKIWIGITGMIIFILFSFVINIKLSESVIQNFITFVSITFGFYMTSLSVLYNSKYIKKLYDEIDPQKITQRKIHTLKAYFKYSAYWALFTISFTLLCSMIANVDDNILQLNVLVEGLLISILSINLVFTTLLFKVFINGLMTEAGQDD